MKEFEIELSWVRNCREAGDNQGPSWGRGMTPGRGGLGELDHGAEDTQVHWLKDPWLSEEQRQGMCGAGNGSGFGRATVVVPEHPCKLSHGECPAPSEVFIYLFIFLLALRLFLGQLWREKGHFFKLTP